MTLMQESRRWRARLTSEARVARDDDWMFSSARVDAHGNLSESFLKLSRGPHTNANISVDAKAASLLVASPVWLTHTPSFVLAQIKGMISYISHEPHAASRSGGVFASRPPSPSSITFLEKLNF